jgi:glycoprotein 3-alpha-L-fucosyltransferase
MEMLRWKQVGPDDKFLALVDMAVVHSECRLCLHLASEYYRKLVLTRSMCISGNKRRLLVRERGRFDFQSVVVEVTQGFSLFDFSKSITAHFVGRKHKAIWSGHRKDFHMSERKLQLYRVYPAFITQRQALYGNESIDTEQELEDLWKQPCPYLEVIFV